MKFTLLIVIFSLLLRPVVPVFSYVINYDHISRVLCENKNKPQLECNGKCYLKKQMAKESEEEKPLQKDTKQIKIENEILFFYSFLNDSKSLKLIFKPHKNISIYINLYNFLLENYIFHPPLFRKAFTAKYLLVL
ncbi:hypothetical protein [Flavobacterium oreochromis]|uniref:Uncharacterized protein n=1 Tax=Flavobacterium columnare TaxID=996 RepID=A0A2D0AI24_9FLAO|nr:hypothetical protein [Flavobacterium oreochromis]OWP79463.1 hypothetical protein BWK62_01850 [Flavobacterium oreochromis]